MVDGLSAYNILMAGMQRNGAIKSLGWDISAVEPNYSAQKAYRFKTEGFKKPVISATLVWNRAYQDEYPYAPALQKWADLQLEIWTVDANGRGQNVDFSNSPVDNVEHIWTTLDPNSEYEFAVSQSVSSDLPAADSLYAVSWIIKESN